MPLFGPILVALLAITPATRVATTQIGPPPPPVTTTTVDATGRCAQWEQAALDAGFDVDDWPTLDRILWCESKCEPGAHNRSGASGLAQIMPMWWHGRDPYDPSVNLTMAKEVHDAQGWRAWSCF